MKTLTIVATRRQGVSKTTGNAYDFISHKIVGGKGANGKATLHDVAFTKTGNASKFGIGSVTGKFVIVVDNAEIWKARGERKYPLYFVRSIDDFIPQGELQHPYEQQPYTQDEIESMCEDEKEDLPF